MKRKSYLLTLKVVLFHFKEKSEDEKKEEKIKQLVLAKNRRFKCGSHLILKNTFFGCECLMGAGERRHWKAVQK